MNNWFSKLLREDFHLSRNYTIADECDKPYGKWPKAFGSAIFLDSNHLIENVIEMMYQNAIVHVTRNNYDMNALMQVDNMYLFVKDFIQ